MKASADLAAVIRLSQSRLRAFIRKRVPVREDAEDILQEVLHRFVRVSALMQPVENVMAWLYRAARNEIIDRTRKKKELPFSLLDEGENSGTAEALADMLLGSALSPEEEYLNMLFWNELEAALEELPAHQCEIFEKTELQGHSFKQIAEQTGISVNTLLSRKHKAVRHLRKRLQELYEDILMT